MNEDGAKCMETQSSVLALACSFVSKHVGLSQSCTAMGRGGEWTG